MVGFFDHKTGMVSRPTLVLNKKTGDAHDNPVIQMDSQGYIWLFSTSPGPNARRLFTGAGNRMTSAPSTA